MNQPRRGLASEPTAVSGRTAVRARLMLTTLIASAALIGATPVASIAANHPMHGAEKAPAVNAAVYYSLGFYPSKYVIQHCTDAFQGTEKWWRWAVEFTDPKAWHNPLCDAVEPAAPDVTFVQVQGGYWEGVLEVGGNSNLCGFSRLPWGMITDIFGTRCHGRV